METKVLLAYDGSDSSVRAARFAAKFMKMFPGTRVTALTVSICSFDLAPVVQSSELLEEISQARIRESEQINRTVTPIFEEEGLPVKAVVKQGFPDEIITRYAEIGGHEQIIMGTRGLTGTAGILLGSVSRKVIAQAPCAVTLVK